ncbi:MAG: hypothetical protein U0R77_05230 [Mycolicibacterium insubricum]
MSTPLRYDDGLIQLDDRAITLRRYHFPSGTSKIIPLDSVSSYLVEPLGLMHRYRLWGSSDLRRWLPLDIARPSRTTLVTLDVDGRWQPAFTPVRPEEFTELLAAVLPQQSS